jgi:hypothetical protein
MPPDALAEVLELVTVADTDAPETVAVIGLLLTVAVVVTRLPPPGPAGQSA